MEDVRDESRNGSPHLWARLANDQHPTTPFQAQNISNQSLHQVGTGMSNSNTDLSNIHPNIKGGLVHGGGSCSDLAIEAMSNQFGHGMECLKITKIKGEKTLFALVF